jgi:hypothetical protein
MQAPDISPWLEFGWPVGLLVLVLSAFGAFIAFMFREMNKRQVREQEERQVEREQREVIINEQHAFIKKLSNDAIANLERAISSQEKTARALDEITRSLALISASCQEKLADNVQQLAILQSAQFRIESDLKDLHKDVLKIITGGN